MTLKKKIIFGTVALLLAIQLIRPAKNEGIADTPQDITRAVAVPMDIRNILETSCYDCHSNHTRHMWYENIQPIGWWTAHHVKEGKEELNFSEFKAYSFKRKKHKLEEIGETVREHEMPLSSYLIVHKNAALTADQQEQMDAWVKSAMDSLKAE